ncbi:helix-turn-helix domain-containing protein [Nocardia brasiliensis]|uniref:helix-turn-helix domain-containing protein n=1 Tax=Nocardia brasiliensis TaxID=37326 RepID=UPI001893527A|nr:helix-turn-helix domain-containing protein [Nocardia brasiliensis]MBF6545295.1 helix-turn-helix domain-containing protein [Nocardia brasiliensis]
MNGSPAHGARNPVPSPAIPTLGATLRSIRKGLGLTRITAHHRHGVSTSYLYEIEADKQQPKLETLDAMITGYNLDALTARHLRQLRSPPADLMPTQQLREQVCENRDWIGHLDDLQLRGVLAAYLDPFWNVLACNELFLSAMPDLEKTYSIPTWLFSPIAREVWVDWEKEAAWNVAYSKAILGIYRDSQQARALIRHLGTNSEFRRKWALSTDVKYGRDSNFLLHVRHPPNSEITSYWLSYAPMVEDMTVLLAIAIPKAHSDPKIPPR